jgi:hypothetical protein
MFWLLMTARCGHGTLDYGFEYGTGDERVQALLLT